MSCRLQGLWHLGLFPEQLPHWEWMLERIAAVKGEKPRVLNLFAYTGAASLLAAAAGAEVTARRCLQEGDPMGQGQSGGLKLDGATIRWMLDDAAKFVAREVRRGRTYHVILVDPPKFGRGPDGEVWDLFTGLPALMANCAQLLGEGARLAGADGLCHPRPRRSPSSSSCARRFSGRGGTYQSGELAIRAAERRLSRCPLLCSRDGRHEHDRRRASSPASPTTASRPSAPSI